MAQTLDSPTPVGACKHVLEKARMLQSNINTSSKESKQLDYVLMHRALFEHLRDAETTGQTDMNREHKAEIARIELPTDRKTPHTTRTANKKPKNKNEAETASSTGANTRSASAQHTKNTQHDDQPSNS